MPHSHRYARRRKLESMYNSNRRVWSNAVDLQQEAVNQNHYALAMTLAGVIAHTAAIQNALEELSKPLAGKPLGLIVRSR